MFGAGVSDMRSEVALGVQGLPAPGVARFATPGPRSLTRAVSVRRTEVDREATTRQDGPWPLADRRQIVWPGVGRPPATMKRAFP